MPYFGFVVKATMSEGPILGNAYLGSMCALRTWDQHGFGRTTVKSSTLRRSLGFLSSSSSRSHGHKRVCLCVCVCACMWALRLEHDKRHRFAVVQCLPSTFPKAKKDLWQFGSPVLIYSHGVMSAKGDHLVVFGLRVELFARRVRQCGSSAAPCLGDGLAGLIELAVAKQLPMRLWQVATSGMKSSFLEILYLG